MRIKTKLTIICAIIFFAGMIILTFTAREIHENSIPRVTVIRPTYERFVYEILDENGEIQKLTKKAPAIETALFKSDVFIIVKRGKNGEERTFARLASIAAGEENGGFTEIRSGINTSDHIVAKSNIELYDGCEVFVLE